MSELSDKLIETLKAQCADLVGFGSIERFRGTAVERIMPTCKTVIGIAFRVLRGSHRGIEEGSTFYQYTTTGVETLEETIMPRAMLRGCAVLEDEGYEALPQRWNELVMQDDHDTNPEMDWTAIYRGKKAENQMDFREAAVKCGLAEAGLGGQLLTDDFGPLQRFCFILTDAEFEETPLVIPHLCDRCGKCIKACPGHAIDEHGVRDNWQCAAYYVGANMTRNPYMPPEAYEGAPNRLDIVTGKARLTPEQAQWVLDHTYFYPTIKHAFRSCICGRACDMACYVHLEERGVLKRKFRTPFRKRPEWSLPIELTDDSEATANQKVNHE